MSKFEILCATMNQHDFSKIKEMNIRSDVVFANQCDHTSYEEHEFDGHTAKMISTQTRGVGINRNLALTYASADICLFADDDVVYDDDMEERVVAEFDAHPDADIMIFHLTTDDPNRMQVRYNRTRKCPPWERMPWGGVRIAVRLHSIRKANVWFTTLFGGGCIFPSGEDSMWLYDAKCKGMIFYVSKESIGRISMEESSWFTGFNEKFFFGKGAWCKAVHSRTFLLWCLYYVWRYRRRCDMSFSEKYRWMRLGAEGYHNMLTFAECTQNK